MKFKSLSMAAVLGAGIATSGIAVAGKAHAQSFQAAAYEQGGYVKTAGQGATCWDVVGRNHNIDPHLLRAISIVESGGRNGLKVRNRNGSHDLGVMQINTVHLPYFAKMGISAHDLQYNACKNISAAAILLKTSLRKHGMNIRGIGGYHSGTPHLRDRYGRKVLKVYQGLVKDYYNRKGGRNRGQIIANNSFKANKTAFNGQSGYQDYVAQTRMREAASYQAAEQPLVPVQQQGFVHTSQHSQAPVSSNIRIAKTPPNLNGQYATSPYQKAAYRVAKKNRSKSYLQASGNKRHYRKTGKARHNKPMYAAPKVQHAKNNDGIMQLAKQFHAKYNYGGFAKSGMDNEYLRVASR